MIDIIYVQYNTTHDNNFVYYEDDQERDWWLLLVTHTPAFFIIHDKKYIMPPKALSYIPPVSHYTTAAMKVISKMTGSVFIPTKISSVMEMSPPVFLLRSKSLVLSIIYLNSLPLRTFSIISLKKKPFLPCLS